MVDEFTTLRLEFKMLHNLTNLPMFNVIKFFNRFREIYECV